MTGQSIRRFVLFSSYFESIEVPAYIFYFLSQLKPHVGRIIYITTNDKVLSEQDRERLGLYVDDVVQVANSGYDFGMWQKVLQSHHVQGEYDELCLVNDSCVCFDSLAPYFNWHQQSQADVTGMTLSYDVNRHLQSFFLCVKSSAVTSVVRYLEGLDLHASSFEQVIEQGELGLSRTLQEQGFSIRGFYEMPESDKTNPMYSHCIDIIRAGVPLIKKKLFSRYSTPMVKQLLLRKNNWRHEMLIDEIREKTQIDKELLERLFAWRTPHRMNTLERIRIARLWVKQKIEVLISKSNQ